ncbi:MAG TPA: hypothetical protein PK777_10340 [Thermoguttaceae bacterium]|nr:hypothetical protein [Thermoguttaceae bacterium]
MNEPIEELQKRLEAATFSGDPGAGPPVQDPRREDAELAEWQRVWRAFGQLLDSAEQTLPEPAWKPPLESSSGPSPKPGWRQNWLVRSISEKRWRRWAAAAAMGGALVGSGLLVWWVGPRTPAGANQTGLASNSLQSAPQEPNGSSPLLNRDESSPGPARNQSASSVPTETAKASAPAKAPASQPSANQETLPWDDQWEETVLSIHQMSRQIEGNGLFQNDPFTGIRQKIQEIQTELDQKIL